MKLFFLKNDSLYTIFSTIEKIDQQKKIEIFIEAENQFFLHERRGKQIKELIENKKIQAEFIVNSREKYIYLEQLGLKVRLKKQSKIKKGLKLLYSLFFNIQYFHLYFYHKRQYLLYLIFGGELLVIFIIFYFLYSLILPSTIISIYPFYQNEPIVYNFHYIPQNFDELTSGSYIPQTHISIPYYTGTIPITETLNITNSDAQYLSAPAEGSIRIVNTTEKPTSLVKDTEIVTDNGLLFKIKESVLIPAKKGMSAGYVDATARARTYDQNQTIIGERGLLKKGTRLYIKKLASSLYQKDIYVEVTKDFKKVSEKDFVSGQDQQAIKIQIEENLEQKKNKIINDNLNKEKYILLPFDKTIKLINKTYDFNKSKQESGYMIQGTINAQILYNYILPKDILAASQQYLDERNSDTKNIVTINTSNISFLNIATGDFNSFVIPTRVNIVYSYNFDKDTNGIVDEIKNIAIKSKDQNEIKEKIASFDEIANSSLSNKPFWNNSTTTTKSRIFIDVQK